MTACKSALRLSGVLLAMVLFSALLLPSTASAAAEATVSVLPAAADENDGTIRVRVQLSSAVQARTTVKFATSNGTALSGRDFYGTFQTVTFAPGQRIKTVPITLVNDRVSENREFFNARIWDVRSAANVALGTQTARALIRDDDSAGGIPTANVESIAVNENGRYAYVRIRVNGRLDQTATVKFATNNGTARSGQDFYGTFQTVRLSPGQTVKTVPVRIIDDNIREGTERFGVRIWDGRNIRVRVANASVTILDND